MTKPCYSLDGVQNPRYCHGTRKVDSILNWYPFIVAILASLLLIDYQLHVIQYMIVCSVINRHLFYPHMPTKQLSSRIHNILGHSTYLNITSHLQYSPPVLSTQCSPLALSVIFSSCLPTVLSPVHPPLQPYLPRSLFTTLIISLYYNTSYLLQITDVYFRPKHNDIGGIGLG